MFKVFRTANESEINNLAESITIVSTLMVEMNKILDERPELWQIPGLSNEINQLWKAISIAQDHMHDYWYKDIGINAKICDMMTKKFAEASVYLTRNIKHFENT